MQVETRLANDFDMALQQYLALRECAFAKFHSSRWGVDDAGAHRLGEYIDNHWTELVEQASKRDCEEVRKECEKELEKVCVTVEQK